MSELSPLINAPTASLEAPSATPPLPDAPPKPAWNPLVIAWIGLLLSPLPAGVLYALNFGRLGHPARKVRALWWVGVLTLCHFLVALRAGFLTTVLPPREHALRPIYLLGSVLVAWLLFLGQRHLFARHLRAGGRKASLLSALGVSVACLLPVFVFGGALALAMDARYEQAQTLALTGKPAERHEAETILRQLTVLDPQDPNYHLGLSAVYYNDEKYADAAREARIVLRLAPGNKAAQEILDFSSG